MRSLESDTLRSLVYDRSHLMMGIGRMPHDSIGCDGCDVTTSITAGVEELLRSSLAEVLKRELTFMKGSDESWSRLVEGVIDKLNGAEDQHGQPKEQSEGQ